jgi:prepilin-type N-terminal cleavage/methylation domain-containing protein
VQSILIFGLMSNELEMEKKSQKGFTLVELIVVMSIISLLSSIVLANLNGYIAKARDSKRISDFEQISKAFYIYYAQKGSMPTFDYTGNYWCEGGGNYEQAMQKLVDAGLLPSIPHSPPGASYCYYNYGPGNNVGALLVTTLEAAPDTTTGIGSSCRPWLPGQNWCDQGSNKGYCMCNPY